MVLPRRVVLGGLAGLMPSGAMAQQQGRGVHLAPASPSPSPAPAPGRTSPPQMPVLMPGTAMHVGPVRSVAVSADGLLVATGGADRTVRLWSGKTGEELGRLSLPLGDGSVGVVDAVAFSPDAGRLYASGLDWAAAPGTSQGMVYVFDLTTNRLVGLMAWPAGFGSRLSRLAVSPNGRQIALAGGGNGLIVRDTAGPAFALRHSEPATPGAVTWAVAWSPDGSLLATAASNGRLRLFKAAADGTLLETPARSLPGPANSLAFSPEGDRLAVGLADRPLVVLVGLRDGATATLTAPAGASRGNLGAVGWGADEAGRTWLMAGGTVVDAAGRNLLLGWRDGRGAATALPVAQDSITDVAAHPRWGVVFGSSDPRWGWVGAGVAGLRSRLAFETERLDFRGLPGRGWGVDAEAMTVEFAAARGALRFDLRELTLSAAPAASAADRLWRPRPVAPTELAVARGTTARSTDRLPDGRVLVGTDDYLVLLDAAGHEVARREVATAAWAVAGARGRTVAVAAHGDGTLRWYALDRGLMELGGLFVASDRERWVAWRADGRFAHSPGGGAKLVGFQQNGRFEPGRVSEGGLTGQWLGIEQFYRRLYDPDQVRRMLEPAPAADAASPLIDPLTMPEIQVRSVCPDQERAAVSRGVRARQALEGGAPAATVPGQAAGLAADDPIDPAVAAGSAAVVTMGADGACRTLDGPARAEEPIVLPRGSTAMRVRLQLDRAHASTQVAAFVNEQNVGRAVARSDTSRGIRAAALDQYVPLFPGENRVEFRAYSEDGRAFTRAPTLLRVTVGQSGAASAKQAGGKAASVRTPTLHALVVGIDAYGGGIQPLRFARADAQTFAGEVQRRVAREYGAPAVATLLDREATLDSVTARLADIATAARPEDAVVIYLAGHGVVGTADRGYAFLTADVTDADAALRGGRGLGADMLARGLAEIRAERVFVFLDTCFAGAFDPRTIGYLNHDTGRYVLAASTRLEEALDGYDGKNGLFAYAVKAGMNGGATGGAAAGAASSVDAFDLGRYVTTQVEVLAQQRSWRQRAVFQAAGRITAFPLVASA